MHFSALLSDPEWAKLTDQQKLYTLRQAIDQVWQSMVITDQNLAGRVVDAKREISGDLDKVSQRIKAVEDRLTAEEED
jgi:hypothetical protein